MPSISQRLGLVKPARTDPFVTSDIANNWQKIDDAPGAHICTSTTRPSWGSGQAGRLIMETDSGLVWRWTGTTFVRLHPSGLLRKTDGTFAHATRTSDFSTSSGDFVTAVWLSNVVVPAGGRPVQITVNYPRVRNANGLSEVAIFRTTTSNGTPLLDRWQVEGWDTSKSTSEGGSGGSRSIIDLNLAPGTYNWSLQIRAWSNGSSTTMEGSPRAASIFAYEV